MKSAWVIGCGFLGSALAGACRAAGARVLTIDPAAPADVCGSAADDGVLLRAMAQLVPDVVFCCTATCGGSAEDYRRAYPAVVESLVRVLPAASRVVFCSSTSLYAGACGQVVTEECPVCAATERAQHLFAAEEKTLAAGGVVARLVPLYGPGRCELLRRYRAGEPCLPGNPGRLMNYLHRDDAVAALLLLAGQGSGVYNVCGETFSKAEIYARLQSELGLPVPQQESAPSVRGVSDMRVESTRLRALGWSPAHTLAGFAGEKEVQV